MHPTNKHTRHPTNKHRTFHVVEKPIAECIFTIRYKFLGHYYSFLMALSWNSNTLPLATLAGPRYLWVCIMQTLVSASLSLRCRFWRHFVARIVRRSFMEGKIVTLMRQVIWQLAFVYLSCKRAQVRLMLQQPSRRRARAYPVFQGRNRRRLLSLWTPTSSPRGTPFQKTQIDVRPGLCFEFVCLFVFFVRLYLAPNDF